MNPISRESIESVFCDVLEKQAFMFAEPIERVDMPMGTDDCIELRELREVRINYSGNAHHGSLTLVAPRRFSFELVENVLGLDSDDDLIAERADDALMELVNVVMGQLLTAVIDTSLEFDLSIPMIASGPSAAERWGLLHEAEGSTCFMVDDYPVLVQMTIGAGPKQMSGR